VAAALRAVLLMALMPEAGYGEILSALFGDLAMLPWYVPFAVPTDTVLGTWREAAGPGTDGSWIATSSGPRASRSWSRSRTC
jgi:hypothetical protein